MLFSRKSGQAFLSDSSKITYPAGLVPPQMMCYQPSIFLIQRKCPASHELLLYGGSSIQTLIGQFGRDLPAKSLEGTEFEKAAIISSGLSTEWKTYHQLLIKQPKDDTSMQLKELLTNNMLIELFPPIYIHRQSYACLFPFYSISGTKFLRHEINKESPSQPNLACPTESSH